MAKVSRSSSSPTRSYSPPPRPAPSRPSQSSAPSRPSAPAPARTVSAPKPAAPAIKAPGGVKTSTAAYGTPAPTARLAAAPAQVKSNASDKSKTAPATGAIIGVPATVALNKTAPPAPRITTNSAGRSEFTTPSGVKVSARQGQVTVKGREAVADNGTRVRGDVVKSPDGTRVNLAKQGTSPQAGELKNLAGLHPQDALARVPKNWSIKVNIGDATTQKIDVKVISRNPSPSTGHPVEVRIHSKDPNPKLDAGANARNHWSARLQMDKDGTQYLANDGRTLVERNANEGHIPLSGRAPAGAAAEVAGEVLRAGGKVLVAAGVAYDAYKIQNAYKSDGNQVGPATVKEPSTVAGGWLGGIAGAALAGAAVGSVVPGAGTAVGLVVGIVGGIAGAIGGSKAGEMAGNELAQHVR